MLRPYWLQKKKKKAKIAYVLALVNQNICSKIIMQL